MTDSRRCPHCTECHAEGWAFCPETGRRIPAGSATAEGSIIGGRYRIVGRIGGGGMADVFEAEHIQLGRRVALKVLANGSNERVARLLAEAKLVAALNHPNICDIADVGHDPECGPFLVLERLYGESLAVRLLRSALSVEEAVEIFVQVLSALHAVHSAGIIHRDLKPENLLLVQRAGCQPLVKLLDFGFAKHVSGRSIGPITRPGWICGTPPYMSPEQMRGEQLDCRSDLFTVGVMLFEALTGEHPFDVNSSPVGYLRILRNEPTPLSERVEGLELVGEIILRALAKEPAQRFASALDMQTALSHALPRTSVASATQTGSRRKVRTASSALTPALGVRQQA